MRLTKTVIKFLALPITFAVTFATFVMFPVSLTRTTIDDGAVLRKSLEIPQAQVLGANTDESISQKEQNQCPVNQPVIGWIDYFGNKIIKESLPIGQSPSACFVNTQEAIAEGYLKK